MAFGFYWCPWSFQHIFQLSETIQLTQVWSNIYIRQQCDNDLISLIDLSKVTKGRIGQRCLKSMVQLGWAKHVTSLISCYLTVKRTHYLQELVLFSSSPICIPCNSISMQSCYTYLQYKFYHTTSCVSLEEQQSIRG